MWQKFSDVADTLVLVAIGVTAGIMRTIITPSNRALKDYLVTFFFSIPVGVLSANLMFEYGAGYWLGLTTASICAVLGRDLITGIVDSKTFIFEGLKKGFNNLIEKYTK